MPISKENESYTYADYCTWNDDKRYELIDGVIYAMSPAPSRKHQKTSMELSRQLSNFLKDKPCEIYSAPFDVCLNADEEDNTVVQPDILVICDKSKLDDKGCKGAPDMVIEILSPSTARMDYMKKFQLYQRFGVREYWIVNPELKTVQVCILENNNYIVKMYGDTDIIPVYVLNGCNIDLSSVFEDE